MPSDLLGNQATNDARFPSLDELRTLHSDLLKRVDAQNQQFVGEVDAFVRMGRETGVLLYGPSDRQVAQVLLNFWAAFLNRAGTDLNDFILKAFDPSQSPQVKAEDCPYQGLEPFNENQAKFFFGRTTTIRQMLDLLNRGDRILAVVGPSGSGKSSVILGGLIPELKSGAIAGSDNWCYIPVAVPGSDPLRNLIRVLRSVAAIPRGAAQSADLGCGREELRTLLDRTGKTCVLFIDQFEEVFTLCQNDETRRIFIDNLVEVIEDGPIPHRLAITMRDDFQDFLPRFDAFYERFRARRIELQAMSRPELRMAVEEPARKVGLKFDEGLLELMLDDLTEVRAGLPLLQWTLRELFERRNGNRLTMEAYGRLGGVRNALGRVAEEVYEKLVPQQQNRARYIFLRLARAGEGIELTSNRIPRKTLYRAAGDREALQGVLDHLVAMRLIRLTKGEVADDDQIEVAHEALFRNWERLADWLQNERERLRKRQRLTANANQWESLKREASALLPEAGLAEASSYDDLNALEQEYLRASREHVEREAKRWQELARRAERQARVATARQLAAQSQITSFSDRRLLLSLEALRTTMQAGEPPISAAEEALREALVNVRGRGFGRYHRAPISRVMFTPDGRTLITASSDRTVRFWDLSKPTAESHPTILRVFDGPVDYAALTNDGCWLAAGTKRRLYLFDLATGDVGRTARLLMEFDRPVYAVSISPNSRWLVAGIETGAIFCWDLRSPDAPPRGVRMHAYGIRGLTFDAGGRWLLTGSDDKTARWWDLEQDDLGSTMFTGPTSAVWAVACTNDGRWLLGGSANPDRHVYLWSRQNPGMPPLTLGPAEDSVTSLTVTHDSALVIAGTGSSDSKVRIWSLKPPHPEPIKVLPHAGWISALVTTSNDRWLITGAGDKTVRLYDLGNLDRDPVVLRGHQACVRFAAVTRDNRTLATAADDGSVQLADLDDPDRQVEPRLIRQGRSPAALSPDGRWLATCAEDHSVLLCDLAQPTGNPQCLQTPGAPVRILQFSPDGRRLVLGTEDPRVFLWDMSNGLAGSTLEGHNFGIRAVAFSPDSQLLVTSSDDSTLRIWDLNNGATVRVFSAGQPISALGVSSDARWLIAGEERGCVTIRDFSDLDAAPRVLWHSARIWVLKVSPDSRWLLTGSTEKNDLRAWRLDANSDTGLALPHTEWVTGIAFTSDSKRLITVSEDPQVRIWDMADLSGNPEFLRGHELGIRAAAISSDNRWLFTGSDDRTARIWPLSDISEEPVVLRTPDAPITELAIDRDNHWLVTASYGGTRAWNLRLAELINLASATAGRNLTMDEWKQYFPQQPYSKTCDVFPASPEAIEEELGRAHLFALNGDAAEAEAAYRQVVQWAIENDDAALCHTIARRGISDGFAGIILAAAERAVALDPDEREFLDTLEVLRRVRV